MKVDITLEITPKMVKDAQGNEKKTLVGHLGTHFDVMDKVFPLIYTERKGVFFDVSNVKDRDIDTCDIDLHKVERDMFVGFYTGFIEEVGYGTSEYFHEHPQLSLNLIASLIQKEVSIIGIDFAGLRRGKEHTPTDQYCADRDIFVVENLNNLKQVVNKSNECIVHTYPMRYAGMSGLPCRVIVSLKGIYSIQNCDFLHPDAKDIREKVFVEEQGFQNEFDDLDKKSQHIVIYETDYFEPIATCRYYESDLKGEYIVGRVAVIKGFRGKGIGSILLKNVEREVKKLNGTSISAHAQCKAIGFYNSLGYKEYGEIEDDEGVPHIWMKKDLKEK